MMDEPHPGYEQQMFAERQAKMRSLAGRTVFWRHRPSGVQFVAIVTKVYAPEMADLLVLPPAGFDVGGGYGVPHAYESVALGTGHLNWQMELDA